MFIEVSFYVVSLNPFRIVIYFGQNEFLIPIAFSSNDTFLFKFHMTLKVGSDEVLLLPIFTLAHTYTGAFTPTMPHTSTLTHSHTHTLTQTRSHTHTHSLTHTQTPRFSLKSYFPRQKLKLQLKVQKNNSTRCSKSQSLVDCTVSRGGRQYCYTSVHEVRTILDLKTEF